MYLPIKQEGRRYENSYKNTSISILPYVKGIYIIEEDFILSVDFTVWKQETE